MQTFRLAAPNYHEIAPARDEVSRERRCGEPSPSATLTLIGLCFQDLTEATIRTDVNVATV
jgi:hypothetical protein